MNEAASRIRQEEDMIMEKLREKAVVVLIYRIKSTRISKPEDRPAKRSTKSSSDAKKRKSNNVNERISKKNKETRSKARN